MRCDGLGKSNGGLECNLLGPNDPRFGSKRPNSASPHWTDPNLGHYDPTSNLGNLAIPKPPKNQISRALKNK